MVKSAVTPVVPSAIPVAMGFSLDHRSERQPAVGNPNWRAGGASSSGFHSPRAVVSELKVPQDGYLTASPFVFPRFLRNRAYTAKFRIPSCDERQSMACTRRGFRYNVELRPQPRQSSLQDPRTSGSKNSSEAVPRERSERARDPPKVGRRAFGGDLPEPAAGWLAAKGPGEGAYL